MFLEEHPPILKHYLFFRSGRAPCNLYWLKKEVKIGLTSLKALTVHSVRRLLVAALGSIRLIPPWLSLAQYYVMATLALTCLRCPRQREFLNSSLMDLVSFHDHAHIDEVPKCELTMSPFLAKERCLDLQYITFLKLSMRKLSTSCISKDHPKVVYSDLDNSSSIAHFHCWLHWFIPNRTLPICC